MRNILITGVGRGIGKALAEKFLHAGYKVYGTVVSSSAISADENIRIFKMDLSNEESIKNCVEKIKIDSIKFDIVINNAGIAPDENETKIVIEKLRQTLEVNLIGTANFTEQILELVNPGAHIIFISSSAGSISRTGHPAAHWPNHYPAYKISKTAINMYMRTLALREKEKIVSSVHPGWVKTDMGGEEADITPQESAEEIFNFATTNKESGFFWFEGGKMDW
jgi:NAD(P)-dependent dehydrogenase (short-subunit alcohol dehydrogenase family)